MQQEALVEALASAAPKNQRQLRALLGLAADEAATLAPAVEALCRQAADGTYLLPEQEKVVHVGLHVLAQARRRDGLPGLLALLRCPPVVLDRLLGDESIVVGAGLLVSLVDGDAEPLLALAGDPEVAGEARWSVFLALARLAREGRIERTAVVALLERFAAERLATDGDLAWLGWRDAVVHLGLTELLPTVEAALTDGRLPPEHPEDTAEQLRRLSWSAEHPGDLALLDADQVAPVQDLADRLGWLIERPRRRADTKDPAAAIALDEDERAWLAGFLVSPQAPEDSLTLEAVDGLFAAIVAGPELVLPSAYLPVIWGGEGPEFASMPQAEYVTQLLMRHWNTVAARLGANQPHEPILFPATLQQTGRRWAEGYLVGVDLRRAAWEPLLQDDEYAAAFLGIAALVADEFGEEALDDAERQEVLASLGRMVLLTALYFRERGRTPRPARATKIGRNEPCPCGSGRKYKKCCGAA